MFNIEQTLKHRICTI